MRYLITGGAGYIGSNLVRTLIKNQENIINLIIRPDSNLKQLSDTKKFCNLPILVKSEITARIQEAHIFLGHHILEQVENKLIQNKKI